MNRRSTWIKSFGIAGLLFGFVTFVSSAHAEQPKVKFGKSHGNQGKGIKSNAGKGTKSNHGKGTRPNGNQSRGSSGFSFSTKSTPGRSAQSHYRPTTTQKSHSGHSFDRRRQGQNIQSFNNHQGHAHNSNFQSHNSNYRSYPSNYRTQPGHGSTHLNISPYGVGLNYNTYGGRFGGISTYYRPTYRQFGATGYGYNSIYSNTNNAYPNYANPNLPSVISSYPSTYSQPQRVPGLSSTDSLAAARILNEPIGQSSRIVNQHFPQVPTTAVARSLQQRAEQAFRTGDYANANEMVRQVLTLDSDNGRLLLFAAQASFAVGDYSRAASQIDQATTILPSDQWDFVVGNFRSYYGRNDYVSQTDRLNKHLADQPFDALAFAVRGYHYGALGYADYATKDLKQSISIDPNQGMAKRLLSAFGLNPVAIDPAEIQAPIPAEIPPLNSPGTSKVIQLIPQFTDAELENAVPVEAGQSILIDGPAK